MAALAASSRFGRLGFRSGFEETVPGDCQNAPLGARFGAIMDTGIRCCQALFRLFGTLGRPAPACDRSAAGGQVAAARRRADGDACRRLRDVAVGVEVGVGMTPTATLQTATRGPAEVDAEGAAWRSRRVFAWECACRAESPAPRWGKPAPRGFDPAWSGARPDVATNAHTGAGARRPEAAPRRGGREALGRVVVVASRGQGARLTDGAGQAASTMPALRLPGRGAAWRTGGACRGLPGASAASWQPPATRAARWGNGARRRRIRRSQPARPRCLRKGGMCRETA